MITVSNRVPPREARSATGTDSDGDNALAEWGMPKSLERAAGRNRHPLGQSDRGEIQALPSELAYQKPPDRPDRIEIPGERYVEARAAHLPCDGSPLVSTNVSVSAVEGAIKLRMGRGQDADVTSRAEKGTDRFESPHVVLEVLKDVHEHG